MKKTVKKIITSSALLLTGMHFINQYIDTSLTPASPSKNDKSYTWKDMNINYAEKGDLSSAPLLLLHNLQPSFSKEEWCRIDNELSKYFHVFELDLPGCGKSDKPNITYINYMFVQLISDFIKEVIQEKTHICASALSGSFSLMAVRMNPALIDKLILINPSSISELVKPVTSTGKLKENIANLPVIGTFLYNCVMSKSSLEDDYKYIYFYNDKNVLSNTVDISYYNAHFHHSNGKYLYGSILANYTNINIIHALPLIKNDIYIISNGKRTPVTQEYKKYNERIHTVCVSNCRLLPQLEIPETIANKIIHICS
ncbi:MAG: alpha/beta fold hydrolase [Eubacterium sp.]|jgi:pimeloyl-ACP methyl ester carboxylesterase|nr:alpha/beta fold hydrolase [Eubacterium sp.]